VTGPRLTALDELFVHQIPEPLPQVATHHEHWRESYFFVLHRPDHRLDQPGDVLILALAHFPAREEMDALQLGMVDGQHVFARHVRPYDGDPHTTRVGPVSRTTMRLCEEVVRREVERDALVTSTDPEALASAMVRIGEATLYADLLAGVVPDIDRSVDIVGLLLSSPCP